MTGSILAHRSRDKVRDALSSVLGSGASLVADTNRQLPRRCSPNRVIVGTDGAIYFTDPTLDLVKGEKQEISFQDVSHLDEKRAVRPPTRD